MDKQNKNVINLIGYAYIQYEKVEYAAAITDAAKWIHAISHLIRQGGT